MPDSFEHTPTMAIRMPNGALTSLAGNIDEHHHCAVGRNERTSDMIRRAVAR